jgi:transposase InsO family protein
MTPSNWYKGKRKRQNVQVDEELIVSLVKEERKIQPRIGTRKLLELLAPELEKAGTSIGRDRLFRVLRRHDLLVPPLPRSYRTTDSRHVLPVFHNLAADVETTAPNQVWVSDITYVRIEDSFVYLSLIMDRHSRRIVGYHCGDSLEALGCIEALDMALGDLPEDAAPIHHSDRGCQYCCHEYVKRLERRGLPVSMTERNHCAENAHAERLNGILKQEYGLGLVFRDLDHARRAVEQAVWIYNNRRPHTSLGMRVPADVHSEAAAA